jgi:hypothetical protein
VKIVRIIFFIGLVTIASCDRPECTNTNPVFAKYQPTDEPYKAELAKQLGLLNPEALRYWFTGYKVIDGKELLTVNVQGNGLCAELVLSGRQWPKLERVINKKGVSYQGAELLGLSFDVQQNEQTEFIYRDIVRIVD